MSKTGRETQAEKASLEGRTEKIEHETAGSVEVIKPGLRFCRDGVASLAQPRSGERMQPTAQAVGESESLTGVPAPSHALSTLRRSNRAQE